MLLKFKNKYTMALDKMIKESNDIGGIIENIVLDLKEGYGLILEVVNLGNKKIGNSDIIKITDLDGVDITKQELLWTGSGVDKNEHVKAIVNSWYKLRIQIKYGGIPLMIVKPKIAEKKKPKTLPAPAPEKKTEGWMDDEKIPSMAQRIEEDWVEKLGYDPYKPLRQCQEKPDETVEAPEFDTTTESFPPSPPPPPPARSVTGKEVPTPKPEGPPNRIIQEGNIKGYCEKCGSSLKTNLFFFKAGGCIQPECENYWDKG